jgi:hypothetical protein
MSRIQQALRQACVQNFGETKEAEIIESAYMQQQLKTPRAFCFVERSIRWWYELCR